MMAEQLMTAILELGQAVAGIRSFLIRPYGQQSPPQPPILPPSPPPSYQQALMPPPPSAAPVTYQYGMPYDGASSAMF
jgi:hypothetical protein